MNPKFSLRIKKTPKACQINNVNNKAGVCVCVCACVCVCVCVADQTVKLLA